MNWYGLTPWTWFLIFACGLAALAFLPTIIAAWRGAIDLTTILIFNLIGCITLICWPIALIMAFTCPRRTKHR